MENVFRCQRLFFELEYNLHIFKFKTVGQHFAVNWVKSVIVSVERKSCNSSFSFCRCFGFFLKSVWVGKSNGFIFFLNVLLVLVVNSNSICFSNFQNIFILKMFNPKNWNFRRKPIISINKFYQFFDKIGFSKRKKNVERIFTVCITSTRTAKCHTFHNYFLLNKNITKIL